MKISFWITAIVLYAVSIAFCNSVQVGTVLFTTTDIVRRCWTEHEKSVLRARLIMQDVLPDPDCIDFSNPKAAMVLMDYFLACFDIISKSCYGKIQNLMYIALSDALGGYLKAYVLPSVKRAYYAGQVKYSEAERLFRLYDNIRVFLKTNGNGWAEPRKFSRRNFHVLPLVITGGTADACKQLRILRRRGKIHVINPHTCKESLSGLKSSKEGYREENLESMKNSKSYSDSVTATKSSSKEAEEEKFLDKKLNYSCKNCSRERRNFFNDFFDASTRETTPIPEIKCIRDEPTCKPKKNTKSVIVPLPMLDDLKCPQSIVLPFKVRPFRNLHSASSAFILEYYYIAVVKCFIAAGCTRADLKHFNAEFYSWLGSEVLPHLEEEKWYPGFGGVLRIIETIRKFGITIGVIDPCIHDTSYVFEKGVEFEVNDSWKKEGKDQPRHVAEECSIETKRHVITAILIVSLLWMFLFCSCAFYSQATRARSVFYGKCSETSSRKKSRCRIAPAKTKSKCINLQFLVKFFKNVDKCEPRVCRDEERQVCWSVRKIGMFNSDDTWHKKECEVDRHKKANKKQKSCLKPKEKPKQGMRGQGDFITFELFKQEDSFKRLLPFWASQSSSVRKDVKLEQGGDAKPDDGEEVKLLWKKPSTKIRKKEGGGNSPRWKYKSISSGTTNKSCSVSYSASAEDSKYSASKQNACCCCSETCEPTPTTCTRCSSRTEESHKRFSSTTMEMLEDIRAKQKPFAKSIILPSTEESEGDDEASSSSESYY